MRTTRNQRRGNVCVLMAFCITILVGVAAVAIDGGAIMDDVQKAQAAADASALAAAEQIYRLWQTGNGLDVGSNAKNAALALAATNGYANDGTARDLHSTGHRRPRRAERVRRGGDPVQPAAQLQLHLR